MILRRCLLSVAAVLPFAYADVSFSSPSAGQIISGNSISVEFAEGSGQPPLADFTTYTLQLCAGGNSADAYDILYTFTAKGDFKSGTYTAEVPDMSVGGNAANAYFLRSMGVAPGGIVINYSNRFSLSDMTGQFSAKVTKGLAGISGTAGPATDNQIVDPQNANAGSQGGAAGGQYDVPYSLQTGLTKYAPMAPVPGTKITKKGGPSAQYPTSGANIWSAHLNLPPPNAQTTFTASQTFSVSMREATHITAQPGPAGDAQRFLARWRD